MKEFNDILPEDFDDLSKHAPLLHALRGKAAGLPAGEFAQAGFVVPENYFNEASEIVSAKTSLPQTDGFTVPENYFEELAERILAAVTISALNKNSEKDFILPENYFEDFSDRITAVVNLHDLKQEEAFDIPQGYFEEFENELPTKLALDNIKQEEGFAVPEGYFEKLTGQIIARTSVDQLNTGSDADVPEGYFDSLADRISARIAEEEGISKTESKEKGRIIVFAEFVKRYAKPVSLAASAALLIAVSIWFLNRDTVKPGTELANQNPVKHNNPVIKVIPADTLRVKQNIQQQPETKLAAKDISPKKKKPLNPAPVRNVKVEKQDILDQMDWIDETTVAEYVSDQAPATEQVQEEELLNDAMQQYLLDDNADPSLYYNDGQENFKE